MLNKDQQKCFEIMKGQDNILLTARAGTGKTFLLNEYIEWAKNNKVSVAVCATTGIAATNIKGVTAHRFFKIPIGFVTNDPPYIQNLMNVDVVIIDEIGMLRIDQFEYIAKAITNANWNRESNGIKPVKLIVVGDFFQLRPVITEKESKYMDMFYPDAKEGYAFQSKYWSDMNFVPCILTKVVRQSNEVTCKALNLIRVGRSNAIEYFNSVSNKDYIDGAIYLCGTNKEANTINTHNYNKLDTKEFIFNSTIVDQVSDNEKPVEDVVKIKVGCRVMIMCNSESYMNGQIGTVEAIFEREQRVKVKLDQEEEPVMVCMNTWEIYDYESTDTKLDKKVIGTYTQMPLRLAYAITIHKSQGQTYDKVNLNPYCWDCGQLYVALSRVKSIEGLHLTNKILKKYLVTSQKVCEFYENLVK